MLNINPYHETAKIATFLRSTFKRQKINHVVIGVSGGIDSAVSLFLLRKVLPAKNIIAVHLPYFQPETEQIKLIEETSGVKIKIISIKEIVGIIFEKSEKTIFLGDTSGKDPDSAQQFLRRSRLRALAGRKLVAESEKIQVGNIMSRVRMIILFDLAKKNNALVCGTENKTEHLLGYFTRFGDAASDIEPLSHLYKTQVYQLAKYLKVPEVIINQKPSANLWKNQTDEEQFGFTYEEADQVLNLYFDQKNFVGKISKMGHPNAKKIVDFAKKNEFKQQTPYSLS